MGSGRSKSQSAKLIRTDASTPAAAQSPSSSVAATPSLLSNRSAWRETLALLLPNRLLVFLSMWAAMVLWPPTPPLDGVTLGDRPNADNLLVDGWLRWDVHWYWQIARNGYTNVAQNGSQRDTVFFPLYPLLVHVFNWVVPDTYAAGMLLSNLCLLLSSFLLFRLVEARHGEEMAKRSLLVMLVWPWSFFLSAMYTESLFLVTVLAAFYFGEKNRWALAGLCAAAAGATRVLGVTVMVGLALLYLEKLEWNWRRIRFDVLLIGLGIIGPAGHMLYLYERFGDPLLFFRNQFVARWGADRNVLQIWYTLKHIFSLREAMIGTIPLPRALHLTALGLCIFGCYRVIRTARWSYGLWGLLYLLLSLRFWDEAGRMVLGVFPLYLWGGQAIERPNVRAAALAGCCLLMGLLMLLFGHWRTVG
jgi:hypothetical protein